MKILLFRANIKSVNISIVLLILADNLQLIP